MNTNIFITDKQEKFIISNLAKHQKEIIRIYNKNKKGIIKASIRSGKTLPSLYYIHLYNKKYKLNENSVIWIANSKNEWDIKNHKDGQLYKEAKKWNLNYLFDNKIINVFLPQSIKKINNLINYEICIYNECQTFTQKMFEHFIKLKIKKIFFITGTLPNNFKKLQLYNDLNLEILYNLNINNALENNSISDYKISIIEIPLNKEKNILIKYSKNRKFYTSELSKYNDITKNIKSTWSIEKKKKWGIIRMRFLNSLDSKINAVKSILNYKKQYLVFANSIKDSLKITKYCYNSHTTDKYLNDFKNSKIPHLCLINKAGTGETFENINGVITLNINKSNVNIIQKTGRSLIKNNKIADIIFIISKDTIQRKNLLKALSDFDSNKIYFYSLNEYLNEIKENN